MRLFSFALLFLISILILPAQGVYQKVSYQLTDPHSIDEVLGVLHGFFPGVSASGSSLKLDLVKESPGGFHYTFSQTYLGYPIYEAGVKVNTNPSGKVTSILNNLETSFSQNPEGVFVLDTTRAYALAAEGMTIDEISLNRCWLLKEGKLHPMYQVISFSHASAASSETMISAQNGDILWEMDRVAYHSHKADADTSGRARVFNPNPCTASVTVYGALFSDNNDMHMPAFEPYIDTVTLKEITLDGGVYKLEGPYVIISDFAANTIAPATSVDGDFFFNRDAPGFEDVMCYYHIDTFQRYIQHLGFLNLWGTNPIKVDPHGRGNADQSGFTPNGLNSTLSFGEGGVDDAEDADVIIHEYGHALSYAGSPDTRAGTERLGLDEGISDYFAAAYSKDLHDGYGWDLMMNWDGHNPFWNGRDIATTVKYSSPISNFYTFGEVWAATMMQIRNEIGAEESDRLQLVILYSLVKNMTLVDAAELIEDADSALYAGIHVPTIRFYFCQREIFTGTQCQGVGIENAIETGTQWSLYPNPNNGTFEIEWTDFRNLAQTAQAVLYNSMGKEILRQPLNPEGRASMQISLPAGVYMVRLWSEGQPAASKKMVVW